MHMFIGGCGGCRVLLLFYGLVLLCVCVCAWNGVFQRLLLLLFCSFLNFVLFCKSVFIIFINI